MTASASQATVRNKKKKLYTVLFLKCGTPCKANMTQTSYYMYSPNDVLAIIIV